MVTSLIIFAKLIFVSEKLSLRLSNPLENFEKGSRLFLYGNERHLLNDKSISRI